MATMKVYVATPCAHDLVVSHCSASLFYLAQMFGRSGFEIDVRFLGISDLEVSRSVLASHFLAEQSYTHLLFVDSDMSFDATLVRRMIQFDEDFVSALYAKRQLNLERLIKHARDNPEEAAHAVISRSLDYVGLIAGEAAAQDREKVEIQSKNGFVTAAQTGMGLCLLKRRVIEEMVTRRVVATDGRPSTVSPWPVPYYSFFHKERVSESVSFSEDLSFCRRWTIGCGGTIWACIDKAIGHYGNFEFAGAYVEKLKAGEG